jgi:hypothetical protein
VLTPTIDKSRTANFIAPEDVHSMFSEHFTITRQERGGFRAAARRGSG